jgi:hypothetical protein
LQEWRAVRRLPIIATLLAALCLALPAAASAQAGDEQYRDPFAGQEPQQQEPQAPADPGAESEPAPAQPTQAPDPATPSQAAGELPRTGFQGVVLLLAYGWVLLVGGAALRRIA